MATKKPAPKPKPKPVAPPAKAPPKPTPVRPGGAAPPPPPPKQRPGGPGGPPQVTGKPRPPIKGPVKPVVVKPSPVAPVDPAQAQADADKLARERDAQVILTSLFNSYDLGSLVPKIITYIQQGYGSDAITVLLSQTPEYKQRFAANDIRTKNGLPALSPAEYIATERSYRQVMTSAGLPNGFYDQHSDFTNMIANDISPTELQGRVDAATEAINKAPASTIGYFKQWYSTGDLIAYALDPTKAAPLVEKRIRAAETAAIAGAQGVNVNQLTAENLGAQNLTLDQTRQGFGFVGQELPTATKLSDIYGGPGVGTDDLVNEVFYQDATATENRQKLGNQERATFGGSSGTSGATFSQGNTSV